MISPWSIPGIEIRLKTLHALSGEAELTTRQIANIINAEFGTTFTRNAIIGRTHRLKLDKRPSPLFQRKETKMPQQLEQVPIALEPIRGISIYELNNTNCHFVLDGVEARPPFTYCGKPNKPDSIVWCEAHYQRVYNKGHY